MISPTTKKLEEFFNLPPSDVKTSNPAIEEERKIQSELLEEAKQIYTSLSTAEKLDNALPTVVGLEDHDHEMDNIADRAICSFEDLTSLGANVPDVYASKIFEVAGQMLKTALEAKNSKTERKLKMLELQIKKARLEQIDVDQGITPKNGANGVEFDRNEILKLIVSNKQ